MSTVHAFSSMARVYPVGTCPRTSTRPRRSIPGVGGSHPRVPEELRAEIEAHMALYPDPRSAILPALEAAQRVHGWCSPEALEQVACVMRLTPAELAAVATFYDMLETTPVGRHSVYVCTNISCSLCGADELYEAIRAAAADDPDFNVRSFECLGACDIAPMASVTAPMWGRSRSPTCRSCWRTCAPAASAAREAARPAALRRPGGRTREPTSSCSTASTSPG